MHHASCIDKGFRFAWKIIFLGSLEIHTPYLAITLKLEKHTRTEDPSTYVGLPQPLVYLALTRPCGDSGRQGSIDVSFKSSLAEAPGLLQLITV